MDYKRDVKPDDSVHNAANLILNAHQSGDVVMLVGVCTVSYEGRGWKYLDEGRRSVVIKPTGAVLVLGSQSVKPENWQPRDANTDIEVDEDNELIVRSQRSSPDEILVIRFTELEKSVHYEPSDDNTSVEGSENEMHDYIIDNPTRIESGFQPTDHERTTQYGDIDVFGKDEKGTPVVIEVKRKKAGLDAVSQLNRYTSTFNGSVRGILVAPSITQSAYSMLEDNDYEFIEMSPTEVI